VRQIFRYVPISRRLLQIVWPFLTVVVLLVVLNTISTNIMSSLRAYVGGEGLWSKAQKESVAALSRYARTQAETDFERYQVAIVVPLGDLTTPTRARDSWTAATTPMTSTE